MVSAQYSNHILLLDALLQATGPLVRMVIQIAVDMKYFLMLMFIIGIGETLLRWIRNTSRRTNLYSASRHRASLLLSCSAPAELWAPHSCMCNVLSRQHLTIIGSVVLDAGFGNAFRLLFFQQHRGRSDQLLPDSDNDWYKPVDVSVNMAAVSCDLDALLRKQPLLLPCFVMRGGCSRISELFHHALK